MWGTHRKAIFFSKAFSQKISLLEEGSTFNELPSLINTNSLLYPASQWPSLSRIPCVTRFQGNTKPLSCAMQPHSPMPCGLDGCTAPTPVQLRHWFPVTPTRTGSPWSQFQDMTSSWKFHCFSRNVKSREEKNFWFLQGSLQHPSSEQGKTKTAAGCAGGSYWT